MSICRPNRRYAEVAPTKQAGTELRGPTHPYCLAHLLAAGGALFAQQKSCNECAVC